MPPLTQLLHAVSDEQADQDVPDTVTAGPPVLIRMGFCTGGAGVVTVTTADAGDEFSELSVAVTW